MFSKIAIILSFIFYYSIFYYSQAFSADIGQHKSDSPVDIESDSLEVKKEENIAIFKGNVEAKQNDLTLRSDQMTVHYKQKGDEKKRSVSKIITEGNVFMTTPKETLQGEDGVFDVEKNIVIMNKNVVITSGENIIKGNKLEYNLTTGKSKMISTKGSQQRVRSLFVPSQEEKQKKGTKS